MSMVRNPGWDTVGYIMMGMSLAPFAALLLSTVAFAGMGLCVHIAATSVSSWAMVWIRSMFGITLFLVWMLLRPKDWPRPQRKGLLLVRGVLGFASLALYFYAITVSNASDAILLTYTYPVFSSLFGFWLLKEPLRPWIAISLALMVLGLWLQAKGFHGDWRAWSAGMCSAVTAGLAVVTVRKCRETEATLWIVMAFVGVASIASAIPGVAGLLDRSLPVSVWELLLLVGVLATIGQLCMTWAYRYVEVSMASLLSTMTIVFTLLMETAIGEPLPPPRRLAGFGLVLLAVWLALAVRGKARQAETAAENS